MLLPRKDSSSPNRSLRVAREPCFAQTARGPEHLGKMFSATLVIANAVQFSVCSGVLRVLGLARADPSGVCSQSAVEGVKPSAQNSQFWLFSRRNGQTTSGLEVGTGPLGRNVADTGAGRRADRRGRCHPRGDIETLEARGSACLGRQERRDRAARDDDRCFPSPRLVASLQRV